MQSNRVLVTGAGGHVGSRLTQLLLSEHRDVVPSFRRASDILAAQGIAQPVVGDLANRDVRTQALTGVRSVAHLATRGFSNIRPPSDFALREESETTIALALASAECGVRRFLFVSSIRVYGERIKGDIDERSATRPTDRLGSSKLELERRLLSLATDDFQVLIVRLSNSFGIAASPLRTPWDLLINDLCREAVQNGTMTLRTNGRQYRDFVPLGEVVTALRSLLFHEMNESGIFLLAGGTMQTVRESVTHLADVLSTHLTKRPEIVVNEEDSREYQPFRFNTQKLASLGVVIQNDWNTEVKLLVNAAAQGGVMPTR